MSKRESAPAFSGDPGSSNILSRWLVRELVSRRTIRRYCRRLLTSKVPRSALDRELLRDAATHARNEQLPTDDSLKHVIEHLTDRFWEALTTELPSRPQSEYQKRTRLLLETAVFPPDSALSAKAV